jgi:hypothetical protein
MNKRIPRKEGQPAKSDKHSDLYTDEDPKGTIQGLQFKNKRAAALSVAKIKRSNRSHNHKTQAAIAMEQKKKMLRPNTELLTEDVMQGQPRFVDISKGTLTAETKRSKAVNKATKYKKGIS